jgi:hypothetical protein
LASSNIGGGTTRLSISVANIAPIIICALDGNGSSNLNFRCNGMSLAIEEIKTIVVTLGKIHIIKADRRR